MSNFLDKIVAQKRKIIENKKLETGYSTFPFSRSLLTGKTIIAEIKKASPSKGLYFSEDRTVELGKIYEACGAAAVSLVTEERYFHGALEDLRHLKSSIRIPVLRKDFIIDEYQILESKQYGADAILLITSLLPPKKLKKFLALTESLGMEAVVEIHTKDELQKALDEGAQIIGINNRNLNTLEVNLNTARDLLPLIPDSAVKIVASGIKDEKDLLGYRDFKVNAFLIGEALVTAINPGEKLESFFSILNGK